MDISDLINNLEQISEEKLNSITAYPEITLDFAEGFEQGAEFIIKAIKKLLRSDIINAKMN